MIENNQRRKKLIEVAFPLEQVSAHSRREKNIRHGHISSLHVWWARRPLAACRAFIYASLVDEPETIEERDQLLNEIADLADWDAVRNPHRIVRDKSNGGSGLTGHQLLERARIRILKSNNGRAPILADPFAGGGAIPLEALRLGCTVEASDLNPVAVLLLKATVEYPQLFGHPLETQVKRVAQNSTTGTADCVTAGTNGSVPAYVSDLEHLQSSFVQEDARQMYEHNPLVSDIRYWGNWILTTVRPLLSDYYPADSDGATPSTYFWSRTIPCPSCQRAMPLLRQFWLVRKPHHKVALSPYIDPVNGELSFNIAFDQEISGNPTAATSSRGDVSCIFCGQIAKVAYVRKQAASGNMGQLMTAVGGDRPPVRGKYYREVRHSDNTAYAAAQSALTDFKVDNPESVSAIPDEPIDRRTLGLRIDELGFLEWSQLFNERQLLAAITFASAIPQAHQAMMEAGLQYHYATVVSTYLALTLDRMLFRSNNQSIFDATRETIANSLSTGRIPPVWDYAELAPLGEGSGSWAVSLEGLCSAVEEFSKIEQPARVRQRDATTNGWSADYVITDPPYYAAVDYAGLSDFFYVWLKRSVGQFHSDLFELPLTPKSQQAIMASERRDEQERTRYVTLMGSAFEVISHATDADSVTGVAFASIDPEAWATLIESLIQARLVPCSSWPIDTEMDSGMVKIGQARLKTSVWMSCRRKDALTEEKFIGDLLAELQRETRERLLFFWRQGIRGADFFVSAIGPALAIFGRYDRVTRPDGSEVTVREFLDIVRREATQVALEQVLAGADLGQIDALSREYVTWVWSYGRAPLDAGEAIALSLATGTSYSDITRSGSIAAEFKDKSKKLVRLRTIHERAREDADFGQISSSRSTPMIENLQYAALLWATSKHQDLAAYRREIGEQRWYALQTLGQAIAGCLPDGDEEQRMLLGLVNTKLTEAGTVPGNTQATARQLPIAEI